MTKRGVTDARVAQLADSLGLFRPHRVAPRNDRIFTLELGDTVTRSELASRIQRVDSLGQSFLATVGMAVTIRPRGIPLLVNDRFIVRSTASKTTIDSLNDVNQVEIVDSSRTVNGLYLLRLKRNASRDAVAMANRYALLVGDAHPDFIRVLVPRELDPMMVNQWHHDNTGDHNGTVDADMDTPLAWEIVDRMTPRPEVKIAVLDGGYDLGHEDLRANLWSDASGSHGKDYYPCDDVPGSNCMDSDPSWVSDATSDQYDPDFDYHGTPVAGLIGSVRSNGIGGAGVCPFAKLILIRRCESEFYLSEAFRYAHDQGAAVISCSWGDYFDNPDTETLRDAIDDAVSPGDGRRGSVVLFAMYYANESPETGLTDLAELPNVICVSASTNWDERNRDAGVGSFVDVLAPSNRGEEPTYHGSLNISTTDIGDPEGYNNVGHEDLGGCPQNTETGNRNYTNCFTGTSAATPIAAGAAGLVLAVRPASTPHTVQRILQDTADKIEDSAGHYGPATGYSSPASGEPSHAFGRINAFEAVRVAAPKDVGGKGGVDLFVRDNTLDWGNTEAPSSTGFQRQRGFLAYWNSADVKIDAGPAFQAAPTNSRGFEELQDESPVAGEDNRVYVRLRNRGPDPATGVKVRAYWARYGTALPRLPDDFWTAFPGPPSGSSEWTQLGPPAAFDLGYSGATQARDAIASGDANADNATIVTIAFPGPAVVPGEPDHYCLLVVVDSDQDHPGPVQRLASGTSLESDFVADELTPGDNNVTQKNARVVDSSQQGGFTQDFLIRNPWNQAVQVRLSAKKPSGWSVTLHGATLGRLIALGPMGRKLVTLKITRSTKTRSGTVSLMQTRVDTSPTKPMGGVNVVFRRKK